MPAGSQSGHERSQRGSSPGPGRLGRVQLRGRGRGGPASSPGRHPGRCFAHRAAVAAGAQRVVRERGRRHGKGRALCTSSLRRARQRQGHCGRQQRAHSHWQSLQASAAWVWWAGGPRGMRGGGCPSARPAAPASGSAAPIIGCLRPVCSRLRAAGATTPTTRPAPTSPATPASACVRAQGLPAMPAGSSQPRWSPCPQLVDCLLLLLHPAAPTLLQTSTNGCCTTCWSRH